MTKTTNYQLPKWEKTDRIQMSDFNDMTATLDEALHGLAVSAEAAQAAADSEAAARAAAITALENKSSLHFIKEVTVSTTAADYALNLSDIDWVNWQKIHIDVFTGCDNGSEVAAFANGNSSVCSRRPWGSVNNCTYQFLSFGTGGSVSYRGRITFEVRKMPNRNIGGSFEYDRFSASITYPSLQSLNLFISDNSSRVIEGNVLAGSHFTFWGER